MLRGTALAPLDNNKLKAEITIVTASSPQQTRKRTSSRRKTRSSVRQQTRSSTISTGVSTKRRKTATGSTTAKRSITLQPTAGSAAKTTNTTIQARTRSDRSCKSKTSLISKFEKATTEKEENSSRKRKSPPPSLEDEPPITIHRDYEQQEPEPLLFPSPSTSVLRSHFPAHNNDDDDEGDNFFDSSIWSYNVSGHVHPRSLNAAPANEESASSKSGVAPQCPSSSNPFFSSNISSSTSSSTSSTASSTWSSDDFNILTQLGKGKFGIVYAATHKEDSYDSDEDEDEGAPVALKILHKKKVLQCTTAPRLLRREVEIQSRLNHDNILRLHGYFHDSSSVYLVLEPSESGDLYKNCMSSSLGSRRLSLERSASYIQQVTSALEYLQKHHVSHRDIKPENLLLCGPNQENIKLCDFGWAVHAPPPRHHMRITLCGTPEYVPPEMLKYEGEDEDSPYTSSTSGKKNKKRRRKSSGGISLSSQPRIRKKYDARFVDSWALGVLAYEMVQGKTPFYVTRHVQEALARSKGCQQHEVIFDKIKEFSSCEFEQVTYDELCVARGAKYEEEGEVFIDFVRGLMKKDPAKRMTMLEALSHPWIC